VGSAETDGRTVRYEWLFRSGDPQARFSVRFPEVERTSLREQSFSTSFRLPTGELRALGRRLQPRSFQTSELPRHVGPTTPHWMQWRDAGRTVTLAGWTGDGWSLSKAPDGESLRLDLHVWRPEPHAAVQNCSEPDDDPPTVALEATTTVTFAAAPRVVPSNLPDGKAAGAIPIFDAPGAHPDSAIRAARPAGPDNWAARAKTLAYGHSDSTDPRYGNGGLLGHDLGGTIAVPEQWADADPVRSFAGATAESGVDVAVRGAGAPPNGGDAPTPSWGTLIADEPRCGALFGREGTLQPAVAVSDFRKFRGTLDEETLQSVTSPGPGSARPYRLDGSRSELLDSALSSDVLRTLLDHRDIATFATPLVGSRDPLVPAAEEALLEPERHGAWTVSPPVAESLADLSILKETEPLWVGSLSEWTTYWRRTRNARRRWSSEGNMRVRAAGEEGVRGFTLLVLGVHLSDEDVAVEGADRLELRRGRAPAARSGSTQHTWLSWDLKPGESARVRFGPEASVPTMPPVRWTFLD